MEREEREKHPESRRRRSPKDRRDFDLVSVDNQPVTSTGPRGRQGPWLQSAHSQCCGIWCRGREVKKIYPLFCIYHQGSAEMAALVQSRW